MKLKQPQQEPSQFQAATPYLLPCQPDHPQDGAAKCAQCALLLSTVKKWGLF